MLDLTNAPFILNMNKFYYSNKKISSIKRYQVCTLRFHYLNISLIYLYFNILILFIYIFI